MIDPDTTKISGLDAFGPTPWTALGLLRRERIPARLDPLVRSYWRPVYRYFRARWRLSNEDAKDLTQGFFASLLEAGALERLDPARGRFRHFLRTSADNFLRKHYRARAAAKRGGGKAPLSLEDVEPAADRTPDRIFAAEWTRGILEEALEILRGRFPDEAALLTRYESTTPAPTYRQLAAEFRLTEKQVEKALARARTRFRETVKDLIARTVSGADLEDEIRELFASLSE